MLSPREVEVYHRDGLVIPEINLGTDFVDKLQRKALDFLAANPDLDPNYAPAIVERDKEWLEFAKSSELLDCVEQIIGSDIILWGSSLFCKSARGGKATPWHQDGQYWPIRPLSTCTAWIAFDHVTPENGCMRFVPGSHRAQETFPHETDDSKDLTLNQAIQDRARADAQGRDIVLAPGDFSLHDVYLIHGSNRNDSGNRRGGLVFRFMPATSLYDRALARQQVEQLGVIDISQRELHLLRGTDRSGGNDIYRVPVHEDGCSVWCRDAPAFINGVDHS